VEAQSVPGGVSGIIERVSSAPSAEPTEPNIEVGAAASPLASSREAGAHAAAEALAAIRRHEPTAALVFSSVRHDLDAVLRGVRGALPGVPLVGATTAGEICRGHHAGSVAVGVLASPYLSVRVGVGEGVSRDWRAALEQALATPELAPYFDGTPHAWAELGARGRGAFALLLSPGNTRHAVSRSFDLHEALKRRSLGGLPIFGGSAADDWRMERNFVLAGDRAVPDGVLVAVLETDLQFGVALDHGFVPAGPSFTVTGADGHELVTLDGRPAAEVYAEVLGTTRRALEREHLTLATRRVLGMCDPLGAYVPAVASWVTPRGGILLTRAVAAGTELSLLEIGPSTASAAGTEAIRKARLRGGISRPAAAITAYCALRPRLLGEAAAGEVPRMAEALGGAPLLGFSSFGEQAPSDDGVGQHTNAVIAALVIGQELAVPARIAREHDEMRREAEALRRRGREELERLVAERTGELRRANESLALEVEQRRVAEAAARRHERAVRTLGACNEALVRATDERRLLEDVCRIVVEVGGYRLCWVGYAESDERRTVRPVACWGDHDGYVAGLDVVWADVPRGRGPVGTAIRTRTPSVIRRISVDPAFEAWRDQAMRRGFASAIALPLLAEGEALGALAIYSGDLDALEDEREVKLLVDLADDLAFGITALRGRAERATMMARLVESDRLAAVGTLAAGVAHEINNPLAYLLGGLDFLDQELAGVAAHLPGRLDEARTALREMRTGGERIRQIVRDLKTFSRGDQDARARLDARSVADTSIHMTEKELTQRARVVRDYGPVPLVWANEARLGQVFVNLLINAAHATPAGAPGEHEIRVRTRTDAAGRAVLEVSDTGSGISPEHLERIFEPFFTTKPIGVGTGLGLWICRNLVTSLGGEISVESAPGEGTAVRVVLPAAPAQAVEAAAAPAPAPAAGGRGRVLVVDDDELVANAVRRALSPEHDVLVETSATAALARLRRGERFGVILCDLMMPDMTGMDLHAEAARLRPEDAARFVFVTGGAFTRASREYLDAVANPRVEKPFDTRDLRALVRDLLAAGAARG
jgi:signal transduction histidine kinase/CheY-like chemotaxis protein